MPFNVGDRVSLAISPFVLGRVVEINAIHGGGSEPWTRVHWDCGINLPYTEDCIVLVSQCKSKLDTLIEHISGLDAPNQIRRQLAKIVPAKTPECGDKAISMSTGKVWDVTGWSSDNNGWEGEEGSILVGTWPERVRPSAMKCMKPDLADTIINLSDRLVAMSRPERTEHLKKIIGEQNA